MSRPVQTKRPRPDRGGRDDEGERDQEKTLASAAYDRLEDMIILGELLPGERVSEQILSRTLQLGRTPVREALQRLRDNHLVTVRPRSGVFVTRLDDREYALLMEVRRPLEIQVAGRAARLATDDQKRRFIGLAASMRKAVDAQDKIGLMQVDRAFKQLAFEASANRFLSLAIEPLQASARRFYFKKLVGTHDIVGHSHAAMIEAIGRGDEDDATRAAIVFLDAIESFLRSPV